MIVVRFKVQCRPDKADELQAAFKNAIGPSRKVDGVINFDIARDLYDPTRSSQPRSLTTRPRWTAQESIPEVVKVIALLGDVLAGAPEITIYEVPSAEKRSM